MSKYIPNSTHIPNILIDEWMGKLAHGDFKILIAITHVTYGWSKQSDSISLSQLEALTGLPRTNVIKSAENLIQLGLVTKVDTSHDPSCLDSPALLEEHFRLKMEESGEGNE